MGEAHAARDPRQRPPHLVGPRGRVHAAPHRRHTRPSYDTQPLFYVRSDDGGETWTEPTPIHERRSFGTDLAMGPNGTLSIAILTWGQDHGWTLAQSTDGGDSWETRPAGPTVGREFASSWHSLAVDDEGTLYLTWVENVDGTTMARISVSTDGGQSWSGARTVGPAGGAQMLAWAEATGPGELTFAWYRAVETEAGGEPTRWYPEVVRLANADEPEPEVVQRWRGSWPVHEGAICESRVCQGEPQSPESRHLMDFTWLAEGPEGRVHAAFASTQWDQAGAFPVYALTPSPVDG